MLKQCSICNREVRANNLIKHERKCAEPKRPEVAKKKIWVDYNPLVGYTNGTLTHHSKGKTKETCEHIARRAESLKQTYARGKFSYQLSNDGRQSLSNHAKRNNLGGYRPHPNKGIWYKETWLDSTWELRVAQSLDENKIEWIRPKAGFIWTDEGRKYYPDFYLPQFDVYLDPKNPYLQIKDKVKIEQAQERNNIRVLMLKEDQLTWESIAGMM